ATLPGRVAQEAYEDWQSATWVARWRPFVAAISYVTSADETGRAVLTAWRAPRRQDCRVIPPLSPYRPPDSGCASRKPFASRTLLDRIAALLSPATAGNLAQAEGASIASAGWKPKKAENYSISALPRNGITGALAKASTH